MEYGAIYEEMGKKGWNYLKVNVPLTYQQNRQPCDPSPELVPVEMQILPERDMLPRLWSLALLQPFNERSHIVRCPESGVTQIQLCSMLSKCTIYRPCLVCV